VVATPGIGFDKSLLPLSQIKRGGPSAGKLDYTVCPLTVLFYSVPSIRLNAYNSFRRMPDHRQYLHDSTPIGRGGDI
jgi:hypothetical protein